MTHIAALNDLHHRTPRRHTPDNVKAIQEVMNEYEDVLIAIEAINGWYETMIPPYFDTLELVRTGIKKSNDQKASKKNKDLFFDEASGMLKDSIQELIELYGDGKRTA